MTESGDRPSLAPHLSYGLTLLILLLIIGGFIFLQSDFFLLRNIEMLGHCSLSKEELVERVGLSQRMNIFQLDLDKFHDRLLRFPEIQRVSLERKLPNTLRLHITERKALCLISKRDGIFEVGLDGVIIRKRNEHGQLSLPVLTGLKSYAFSGQPPRLRDRRFFDGSKIISIAHEVLRSDLSEVDLAHYRLYTIDSIQVELGNSSRIEEKLSALRLILSSNSRAGIIGVDLRVPSQPIVLTNKGVTKKPQKNEG